MSHELNKQETTARITPARLARAVFLSAFVVATISFWIGMTADKFQVDFPGLAESSVGFQGRAFAYLFYPKTLVWLAAAAGVHALLFLVAWVPVRAFPKFAAVPGLLLLCFALLCLWHSLDYFGSAASRDFDQHGDTGLGFAFIHLALLVASVLVAASFGIARLVVMAGQRLRQANGNQAQ